MDRHLPPTHIEQMSITLEKKIYAYQYTVSGHTVMNMTVRDMENYTNDIAKEIIAEIWHGVFAPVAETVVEEKTEEGRELTWKDHLAGLFRLRKFKTGDTHKTTKTSITQVLPFMVDHQAINRNDRWCVPLRGADPMAGIHPRYGQ